MYTPVVFNSEEEEFRWNDIRKTFVVVSGWPRCQMLRNIAENCNRLSRVHERYRQTDRRQTDGRTGDSI